MNPSFNPLMSKVPHTELRGGKIGLILGFHNETLYRQTSRSRGDTPPMNDKGLIEYKVHCWKCRREMRPVSEVGRLYSYDIIAKTSSYDSEPPELTSLRWCYDCANEYEKSLATLTCNNCGRVVASVNPGKMPNGFEVTLGMKLHCNTCPTCTPGTEDVAILEMPCPPSLTSSTTEGPAAVTSMDDHPQGKPLSPSTNQTG